METDTLALFLVLVSAVILPGVRGDLCHYQSTPGQEGRDTIHVQFCSYGCCGPFRHQTCCDPPVGLIVGCTVGVVVVLIVLVTAFCFCCICARQHARSTSDANRARTLVPQRTVVFTTAPANLPVSAVTSSPPAYGDLVYAPPPSYDEVIGQSNPAFKRSCQ